MLTLTYFIWFLTAGSFMFLLETFLHYLITNKRKLSFFVHSVFYSVASLGYKFIAKRST